MSETSPRCGQINAEKRRQEANEQETKECRECSEKITHDREKRRSKCGRGKLHGKLVAPKAFAARGGWEVYEWNL
jgi:hypothetical protein